MHSILFVTILVEKSSYMCIYTESWKPSTLIWCHLYRDSDGLEEESQLLFGDSEDQDGVAMEDMGQRAEHVLWVDKYSPRQFTELLSDDVRFTVFLTSSLCVMWIFMLSLCLNFYELKKKKKYR